MLKDKISNKFNVDFHNEYDYTVFMYANGFSKIICCTDYKHISGVSTDLNNFIYFTIKEAIEKGT